MANRPSWHKISTVFQQALERPTDERSDWLEQACGGDAELRQEVGKLLEAHQRGEGILDRPVAAIPLRQVELAPGSEIGPYRILAEIGRGGMGVVYRAEDSRLERTVALKFLAPHFMTQEGRERFIREAKAAASLDHPNICTVYEIHDFQGEIAIAMACIEGQSLDRKIEAGPLTLDEALEIACQLAEGLREAHAQGIVHRDIKPANLMITPKGDAKLRATIMDFGLAQLADRSKLTKSGITLGTPGYMSPEQLQAMATDHRTDVWSAGVVLYEMLVGEPPFHAEHAQAVAYAIVNEEPPAITGRRKGVPLELDWIVDKALAKDPAERYQRADDMLVDLRRLQKKLTAGSSTVQSSTSRGAVRPQYSASAPGASRGKPGQPAAPGPRTEEPHDALPRESRQAGEQQGPTWKRRLPWALFGVSATTLLAVFLVHLQEASREAPLRRFAIRPPVALDPTTYTDVAISPNGNHVAFTSAGDRQLWVHDLHRGQARALEGIEGVEKPFWAPDSKFIGFAAGGEIRKVSVQGGPAVPLCEIPAQPVGGGGAWSPDGGGGASWSPDGESIVFTAGAPPMLYEVSADGGSPELLVSSESEESYEEPTGAIYRPHFLPSEAGRRVLLFAFGSRRTPTMMALDLDTPRREILGPGTLPVYSPSGHIVYQAAAVSADLWAMPFSLATLKATGEAFPIAQDSRDPTVSADQTLVYIDGPGQGQQQLVRLDRRGAKTGEIGQAHQAIRYPALSPDGLRLAVAAGESSNFHDVWIHDLERGVRTRLSSDSEGDANVWTQVWSPGGEEVAFTLDRGGNRDILVRKADGSGDAKVLVATAGGEFLCDWSQDGRYLVYELQDPENRIDLWYLERAADGSGWEPRPFLQTPFEEVAAQLSPDGRYLAYVSNESGEFEVYVRPFPSGRGKWTVSSGGGRQPRWSRNGRELLYAEGVIGERNRLVAVRVSTAPSFSVGSSAPLFEHPSLRAGRYPRYEVSPDGQEFLFVEVGAGDAPEPAIRVVQNWFAAFRDR